MGLATKIALGVIAALVGLCVLGAVLGKNPPPRTATTTPGSNTSTSTPAAGVPAPPSPASGATSAGAPPASPAAPAPPLGPSAADRLAAALRAHLRGGEVRAVNVDAARGTATLALTDGAEPSLFIHRASDALNASVSPDLWTQNAGLRALDVRVEHGPHFLVAHIERDGRPRLDASTVASPDVATDLRRRAYWSAEGRVVLNDGDQCPADLWALVPGDAPGRDEFERRANEQRRAELAARLRNTLFTTPIDNVGEVELGEYDFASHSFPLTLFPAGDAIVCNHSGVAGSDSARASITIALAAPRPVDPTARSGDLRVGQYEWRITPLRFRVPVPESEARAFGDRNRGHLNAQIGWRFGSARVDRRMVHEPGNPELMDHGAGRVIVASDVRVRVYNSSTEEIVVDTAPMPPATRQ